MENLEGMHVCETCGRGFALIAEERYTVRTVEKTGLAGAFSGEESDLYDAFDCPHCGCQNIVSARLRQYVDEQGERCCEDCGCHEGERTSEEGGSDGE